MSAAPGDVALIVIAKEPVPGRVKTRLCPPCVPEQAAELSEAALADTLHVVAAVPAPRHMLALDGAPGPWLPDGFEVVEQTGDGLADRLAAAFCAVGGPALLVGMDTPQLTAALLDQAQARLAHPGVDAVLGLAADGGFWAVGLRRADPAPFADVPMSTAKTGAVQLRRLRALGLHTVRLPTLRDVDDFADARAVAARAPETHFAAELERIAGALRPAA